MLLSLLGMLKVRVIPCDVVLPDCLITEAGQQKQQHHRQQGSFITLLFHQGSGRLQNVQSTVPVSRASTNASPTKVRNAGLVRKETSGPGLVNHTCVSPPDIHLKLTGSDIPQVSPSAGQEINPPRQSLRLVPTHEPVIFWHSGPSPFESAASVLLRRLSDPSRS